MKTIGILGGGQLGYMLALAGYPLGLHFKFLDPSPEAPVGRIAHRVTAQFDDKKALEKMAAGIELVTYEFENVPVDSARFLEKLLPVLPPPVALEMAQDRLSEKQMFQRLGIATTEYAAPKVGEDPVQALKGIGYPAVIKTRRMGYDGKGQWKVENPEEFAAVRSELPKVPLVVERLVKFRRELSVLAVRSRTGEIAIYPLVENHHREGILRLSLAPAQRVADSIKDAAEEAARKVLEALEYVGVLAIEFFECDGKLLANEMAPRVHNSGHWTIEGAVTSQFENHLRGVMGWPLGSTATNGHSAMINLIGEAPEPTAVLGVADGHLHLYGKTARPGRKLGHFTVKAASADSLAEQLRSLPAFFQRPEYCLSVVVKAAERRA